MQIFQFSTKDSNTLFYLNFLRTLSAFDFKLKNVYIVKSSFAVWYAFLGDFPKITRVVHK